MFKRRDRETFKGRFTSGKKYLSAKHSTPRIFRACTSLNLTQILRLLSLSNFTQQSHEIHCLHIFFIKHERLNTLFYATFLSIISFVYQIGVFQKGPFKPKCILLKLKCA